MRSQSVDSTSNIPNMGVYEPQFWHFWKKGFR